MGRFLIPLRDPFLAVAVENMDFKMAQRIVYKQYKEGCPLVSKETLQNPGKRVHFF